MGAQKPGFYEDTSLRRADSRKNPVSWCDAWAQKPGFCENIRFDA